MSRISSLLAPVLASPFVPLALGLGAVAADLVAMAPAGAPPEIAMVFPPWWTQRQAFAAAGELGDVVRLGAAGFVVVVAPRHLRPTRSAAWFTLDARLLPGCTTFKQESIR